MKKTYKPQLDWLLVKVIKADTAAVTQTDIEDTDQVFKVIAVGPGRYQDGVRIVPQVKPGDVVLVEKLADRNTPTQVKNEGYDFILAERVMAIIEEKN